MLAGNDEVTYVSAQPSSKDSTTTKRDGWLQRLYRSALLGAWRWLYFGQIRVNHRPSVQARTLYLCTHRNGGIDGAIAHAVAGCAPVPVAASQITRSFWGRWTGCIEVVRATDRARHGHVASGADPLKAALSRLSCGESLLWFPEGSSDGGPRLLPVHRGAARLLAACVERGLAVRVVVMGLHYRDLVALQSDVEVEVEEPLGLQPPALAALAPENRIDTIQLRVEAALRAVSIAYPDSRTQKAVEALTACGEWPIARTRRTLLHAPRHELAEWLRRCRTSRDRATWRPSPWMLPWLAGAIAWLPVIAIAWSFTARADRNNKAFIRSLLATLLLPLQAVVLMRIAALAACPWWVAVLTMAASLPAGLLAQRHLRAARGRRNALAPLGAELPLPHGGPA